MAIRFLFFCILALLPFRLAAYEYDVTDYGVKNPASEVQTVAIQKVIDLCCENGGGTVRIPSGTFVSGTLYLRDNVMLYLEHGAVLKGSGNLSDYPGLEKAYKGLVQAENVSNVGISGSGTIDANGNDTVFHSGPKSRFRIHAANFEHCDHISISGVRFQNASYWTLRLDDCEFATINSVEIHSTSYFNNDGIDLDGRNIVVSDCIIDCIDDAICIKSYYRDRPCENIVVSNCIVSSNCNAIKLGTASHGGFKNISISNCTVKRPSQNDFFDYKKYIVPGITDNYTNNSGIALELVDGGVMENIAVSNITMYNTLTPIFIRLGERRFPPAGIMRGISISNVVASANSLMSCSISGIPGHCAEDIRLSNIILNCPGGGRIEHTSAEIPEAVSTYPENKIFGAVLPAYGFFVRHVNNLSFDNVLFRLDAEDDRYALYLEDCRNISVNRVGTVPSHGKSPYICSVCTGNLLLSDCGEMSVGGRSVKPGLPAKCASAAGKTAGQASDLNYALVKWSFRTRTSILCELAAENGITALDMVDEDKWDIVLGKGLKIAVADGVDLGIERGFSDRRWHAELQKRYSHYLPVLAEKGVSQVVCYSGINPELSSEEAMDVCVEGLLPVVKLAEKLGITLVMELISSREPTEIFTRHRFPHYLCDNPEWGAALCRKLKSGNFRLLYDVWHMEDMGRDVCADIEKYGKYIAHYHVHSVPQKSFADILEKTSYKGYVGIEPDRIENKLEETIRKFYKPCN